MMKNKLLNIVKFKVRRSAVSAIVQLAFNAGSRAFVFHAVPHLVDAFNDEIEDVKLFLFVFELFLT